MFLSWEIGIRHQLDAERKQLNNNNQGIFPGIVKLLKQGHLLNFFFRGLRLPVNLNRFDART